MLKLKVSQLSTVVVTKQNANIYKIKHVIADSRFILTAFIDITFTETGNNHNCKHKQSQVCHNVT